jgi:hypothetical protein
MFFRILSIWRRGVRGSWCRAPVDPVMSVRRSWVNMRMRFLTMMLVAFSVTSAAVFVAEFRNFARSHQTSLATDLTPGAGANGAFSLASTQDSLRFCAKALAPPLVELRPRERVRAFAETCARLARATVAAMPTHGLAYYLQALLENLDGTPSARDRLLAQSARFAPAEGWLAERRFSLAIGRQLPDNAYENSQLAADTAILLTTQSGAELVAEYYFQRPGSRAYIARIADRAARRDQTRLLNLLTKKRAGS